MVDLKYGQERPIYYAIYKPKVSRTLLFYCVKSSGQHMPMITTGTKSELMRNASIRHARYWSRNTRG